MSPRPQDMSHREVQRSDDNEHGTAKPQEIASQTAFVALRVDDRTTYMRGGLI